MNPPYIITPQTLEEALEFLAREGDRTLIEYWEPDAAAPRRLFRIPPEFVLQVKAIPELAAIELDPRDRIRAGAAVPLETLTASREVSARLPSLRRAAAGLSDHSPRIREPLGAHISCPLGLGFMLPTLVIHQSDVILRSAEGERRVPVERFTSSTLRVLRPNELLVAVEMNSMTKTQRFSCQRALGGTPSPFLLVGIAALGALDDRGLMSGVRLAGPGAGAAGGRRFSSTEARLNGRAPTAAAFRSAARRLCEELSDPDGPSLKEEIEEALLQNLLIKALFDLFPMSPLGRDT